MSWAAKGGSMFRRAVNRLGRSFGMMPFPMRFSNHLRSAGRRGRVFDEIYSVNYWGSGESPSGPGSELRRTAQYRVGLVDLLRRWNVQAMFDAPCGDLNWMRLVLDEWPMRYEGADISERALAEATARCPGVNVRRMDICVDPFPEAEIWHCRDALFHLSFADIWLAFQNASRSGIRHVLLTTNKATLLRNVDIETGGMRYLDLERPPFNLPKAIEYIRDFRAGEFPRYVGLWPIAALSESVAEAKKL
jgi:hypothetical protein